MSEKKIYTVEEAKSLGIQEVQKLYDSFIWGLSMNGKPLTHLTMYLLTDLRQVCIFDN